MITFCFQIDDWAKAGGTGINVVYITRSDKMNLSPIDETNIYSNAVIKALTEDL